MTATEQINFDNVCKALAEVLKIIDRNGLHKHLTTSDDMATLACAGLVVIQATRGRDAMLEVMQDLVDAEGEDPSAERGKN